MSDLYTDDELEAVISALLGFDPHPSTHDAWAASARRLLDAVAPTIAARAVREARRRWISERADEIGQA